MIFALTTPVPSVTMMEINSIVMAASGLYARHLLYNAAV